ncbi:MAG: ABC transporter permease subunit [Pleurocapsa minor GSE-CHR-MK-17-07R]|jgi:ABC-type sugar transport system permease subunit|nr:ABC transporter permease subunit [Pleurocapsa minor GSE-CHR-MK 17-07R]
MATTAAQAANSGGFAAPSLKWSTALQALLLLLVDGFGAFLAYNIWQDGNAFFAIVIVLTLALITVITLVPRLWPLKWISPALALMILLSVYPLLYTGYIAFTNFSDGHRYTKTEAVELLAERRYLPEGGATYAWSLYQNAAGAYGLWLTNQAGESFFATPEGMFTAVSGEAPGEYEGYALLEGGARFRALNSIEGVTFGDAENAVGIQSLETAGAFEQQWVYDAAADALTDRATGVVYTANNTTGEFTAPDGSAAPFGFWVSVGFDNFGRIISSALSQGPLIRVILWTIGFAVIGSLSGFALGLAAALLLDGQSTWLRVLRAVMIVPYAVPGLVSVLVWRGMLNANIGIIPQTMESIFGWAPPFSSDPGWAKFAILLVNIWFSAPYFMLIGSGALQSISSQVYEAAQVDGASRWVQFWKITLPLVLVALGPLLIASIIFNFNNFFLMEALFGGGPPIAGTSAPPVGHTDNLISYTYRLAFSAGGTKDYGLASALGVVIFFIVGILTLLQFRLTRTWEQVSENV